MSTPLSFCDISARYGQMPAPQKTIEEQTGWNSRNLFLDYLNKVRQMRAEEEEHAEEDALMAMIDAMNAPEEDRQSSQEWTASRSLLKAGPAVYNSEKFAKVRKAFDGEVDITVMPAIQVLLASLSAPGLFKEVDDIQEEQQEQEERIQEEERLEVTEERDPSQTPDPDHIL